VPIIAAAHHDKSGKQPSRQSYGARIHPGHFVGQVDASASEYNGQTARSIKRMVQVMSFSPKKL
jgi:hypothetical protein